MGFAGVLILVGLMRGWWFALLKMVIKLLCRPSRKPSKAAAKEKKQDRSEDSVPAAGSGTSIEAGNKPSGENHQFRRVKSDRCGTAHICGAHGARLCKQVKILNPLKPQTFSRDNTLRPELWCTLNLCHAGWIRNSCGQKNSMHLQTPCRSQTMLTFASMLVLASCRQGFWIQNSRGLVGAETVQAPICHRSSAQK